ncbi:hypothetical protein T552_00544 [Pneumocystis carinii B80]|uniref:HTH APSES-type domain-containing protein n=1 Tax=Pneumocystis carinii (strain B80) TaxID=1408658 RepID=A0A0W4ZR41_PNEC8|nr:hypothetical protein T552_00544 [Pneumocystis carinii B80]KTW30832.1 hypothetical protein T552_00544 [Pneumocystis carinii B80]
MRNLPEKNKFLGKIKKSIIVKQCKIYKTLFEENVKVEFILLPVIISEKKESNYIVLMKHDKIYISATSMFRFAFPSATRAQERLELDNYVKHLRSATTNIYVAGIWVTSEDALLLAEDYGIRTWIKGIINASEEFDNITLPVKNVEPDVIRKYIECSVGSIPSFDTIVSRENESPFSCEIPFQKARIRSTSPERKILRSPRKEESEIPLKPAKNVFSPTLSATNLNIPRISKKRPLELSGSEDFVPIKRSKIEQLEKEVVIERKRVKTLIALVFSLGISATLPYIL